MTKVITYGTYDLLHHGHIRLLERAKELGDYLVVGITADGFDRKRGKINVQQSLMERIEAIKATGLADEIVIEEYEGQKIDDILRYDIDIFTVGSDWKGHFDYLNDYCKVIYLERTEGISSTELRSSKRELSIGLVGEYKHVEKFLRECQFVNGIKIQAICSNKAEAIPKMFQGRKYVVSEYSEFLDIVDAVYIISHPTQHFQQVMEALEKKKHVLCESPITLKKEEVSTLFQIAKKNNCILMESQKTAYAMAYHRLQLLIKGGHIGQVVSVDATCTSLKDAELIEKGMTGETWPSICAWGPTAMLAVFQILGIDYVSKQIVTKLNEKDERYDLFTKIDFVYKNAVASVKVGKGVKSEGELVVSGTEGYIYVPAPWWKTDYFEIRYENNEKNRKYFYQLDGEGIRYEIVSFVKSIETGKNNSYIDEDISKEIVSVIDSFYQRKNIIII